MKKILSVSLIISAFLLLLPLSAFGNTEKILTTSALIEKNQTKENKNSTSFKVYDMASCKTTEISVEDYIFGVVAAEMPALYEEEALKAQAVAAYTFACNRKAENKDKSYDITNDHATDQSYITKEEARKKWGNNAEKYEKIIEKVVEDTKDYAILYNDKPIIAVYHALSSGKTEDADDVWGIKLDYLKPVSSEGDKLSKNYVSKVSFTPEELKEKLLYEIELTGEKENYFNIIDRTSSGMVTKIKVCNEEISGTRLRSILNLRSSNFTVDYAENNFIFTVYGYGHGVGMSQNGANYMAKQGSNFKEILNWYYSNCEIKKVEN